MRQFGDIGVRGRIILTRISGKSWVGSGKFLLVLASTVILGFESRETHFHTL
jgi:hypothetical protein